MTLKRLMQSLCIALIRSGAKRADFIRRHHIFGAMGKNCSIQKRKIPLYPNLIRVGNNVHFASNVSFLTHDISHCVFRGKQGSVTQERIGCIEIGDNVFVGSGTHILYNTKIGSNVIIGTCSVVTKDIPDNCVAAGVPAKVICSIDEYAKKHMSTKQYPDELRPGKQTVSDELAKFMWKKFEQEHSCKGSKQ